MIPLLLMSLAHILRLPLADPSAVNALFYIPLRPASMAADIAAFKDAFDDIMADTSVLKAGEFAFLDEDASDTIDEADRDYWLDAQLRRFSSLNGDGRLVFADPAPTTFDESDPLGLAVGRTNSVVIIDDANTGGVYVGQTTAGNQNRVYTDAARTAAHATPFLFGTANGSPLNDYNHGSMASTRVWKDIESLNELNLSSTRRFPTDGTAMTVYLRGGSYDFGLRQFYTLNVGAVAENSRIVIRAYPGEDVHLFLGPLEVSAGVFGGATGTWQISRPDVRLERLVGHGYRLIGGLRYFAGSGGMIVAGGARNSLIRCQILDLRGIATDHANAGEFPQYVDQAYAAAARSSGVDNVDIAGFVPNGPFVTIRNNYFEKSGVDFPNLTTEMGGEPLDLFGDDAIVRRNKFAGCAPHAQVRATNVNRLTFEFNDVSNADQAGVIILGQIGESSDDHTIRYNYVHDYGLGPLNQGIGMQLYGITNSDAYANVFSNPNLTEENGLIYGLALATNVNTPPPPSGETIATTGNRAWGNIFYKAGFEFGFLGAAADGEPENLKLSDNDAWNNVFVDPPQQLLDLVTRDAPVHFEMGPHDATVAGMMGNILRDSVFWRTDASLDMLIEQIESTSTPYEIGGIAAAMPTFTGNVVQDPGFADPDNEDFTGVSLPFALDANTPLTAPATGPDV